MVPQAAPPPAPLLEDALDDDAPLDALPLVLVLAELDALAPPVPALELADAPPDPPWVSPDPPQPRRENSANDEKRREKVRIP